MKALPIFLMATFSLCTFASLQAQHHHHHHHSSSSSSSSSSLRVPDQHKPGVQLSMVGTGKQDSILLANNIFYEPCHKHDQQNTVDWQVGDTILLLPTRDPKRFTLTNQRTGESGKFKILKWS